MSAEPELDIPDALEWLAEELAKMAGAINRHRASVRKHAAALDRNTAARPGKWVN